MGNLVSVDKLEMGMILQNDVIDENTGVTLVAKNMGITKALIKKLTNHGVDKVYIKEEEIPLEKYNKALMDTYVNVERNLDNIFMELKDGKTLKSEDLVGEVKSFVGEVIKERDILTQMRLLKKRDDYTFNHSLGVSTLAASMGKWLDYSEEEVEELAIAGLFHDIGKLKISESIINKPGNLTLEEFEIIKKHSTYSADILNESGDFNEDIILGVLQHHEKMDGSGYPDGIKGDKIHRYGKIIAICDIYHALTSRRVYKDKENPLKVADFIRTEGFTKLDPFMTGVFLKNISKCYVGNKVILSTGEIGEIIYIYPQDDTKPIVKVADKFVDLLKQGDIEVVDIII